MLVVVFRCSFNDLSENSKRSRYSGLDLCSHCVCESQDSEQPPVPKVQIWIDFEIQALMCFAVCSWFLNFGWVGVGVSTCGLPRWSLEWTPYIQISFALNWVPGDSQCLHLPWWGEYMEKTCSLGFFFFSVVVEDSSLIVLFLAMHSLPSSFLPFKIYLMPLRSDHSNLLCCHTRVHPNLSALGSHSCYSFYAHIHHTAC